MSSEQQLMVTDFSPKAITEAVRNEVVQKPYSLLPTVLGALGVAGGLMFASVEAGVIGLVALSAGIGSGVWNFYFRHDQLAEKYYDQILANQELEKEQKLRNLKSELLAEGSERGATQLDELQGKHESFLSVLQRQFDEHELTYSQQKGTVEQVFLAIVDNLHMVVVRLDSVSEIRADAANFGTRTEVLNEVEELLDANANALELIDQTAMSVARIQTRSPLAKTELEQARAELAQAASFIKKLDMRNS